jgi:hypothetical protein
MKIDNIEVFEPYTTSDEDHIFIHNGRIRISWSGSEGWGQYDLWKDKNEKWHGKSEYMDSQEDKSFINGLMKTFIDNLIVDE